MFDFFSKIGELIANFFGFIQDCINGVTGFVDTLKSWWESALLILGMFPDSVVKVIVVAFALLLTFIVIEIARDFL